MFTGIIETLGVVREIQREDSNIHFTISSPFTHELRVDQSVAHDGVCLTVVAIVVDTYTVTAIEETLRKTKLGAWVVGTSINLERSLKLGDRLDGHMVQGHVDLTGVCTQRVESNGSWEFAFDHPQHDDLFTVPKGSITVNGVSLTVVQSTRTSFSVAIIPYTFEHTTFHLIQPGDPINLEFDILGKYLTRYLSFVNSPQHTAR